LLRNYAHGAHWKRFVASLEGICDVRVFVCVWEILGSPNNNFAQSADKTAATRVETAEIARAYPPAAATQLVSMQHWIDEDAEGNDGRYINQWAMVARCWELMEATLGAHGLRPRCVIRARPDLRVACLPLALDRPPPFLALQERLWGSDCFFYGDYESMRPLCAGLASRYDEYTRRLGQASSEPMMQAHVEECGLTVMRFARCCSVDRT
jgi:hypothetical protein